MSKNGVDVSKWQGNIDWNKAKASGIQFAILREGYGKESATQVDKQFENNYSGAKAAGVPVGVYHYSYADSTADAVAEAKFCLKNIAGKRLEYPVCFDIEDSEMLVLTNQQRTDICISFCETIEAAGYYAMIYCNLDWYKNKLISEQLKDYDLWIAQWNVQDPSVDCGIWQKSSSGSISGISGNVDLDEAFKDYPSIMKLKGINGYSSPSANPDPKINYTIHTVQKGESLWVIAQKLMGAGDKYPEIKKLNGLTSDTIQPGQVLKIPK